MRPSEWYFTEVRMDDIFAGGMQHNLNLIVQFHNTVRALMNNEIVTLNQKIKEASDEEQKRKFAFARDFYPTVYHRMLRTTTFLMMYSYLEEFLYHVPAVMEKEVEIGSTGSIMRFKSVFKEVLEMDLGS